MPASSPGSLTSTWTARPSPAARARASSSGGASGGSSGPWATHEHAVGAAQDVQLDRVDAGRGGRLDGREAVLGRQGGRPAVPDPHDVPLAPQQLQHRASIAAGTGTRLRPWPSPCPGRSRRRTDDDAPLDPSAIELRYRYHRALRHARVLRRQESRLAGYRFYIVLVVLLALAVAFVVGSWHEIQRLFGL